MYKEYGMQKQIKVQRILLFILGIAVLSIGLALNVKSYLGVAPILTTPSVIAEITGWGFPDMLFLFYMLFILLQFVLCREQFRLFDLVQLPIGLGITRLIAICTMLIPTSPESPMAVKIIVLILAIIVTGIGVALHVDMQIAPNPADGLADAVGERFKVGLGMGKNIVDITSVVISFFIGMVFLHSVGSIGIGTLAAGLLVGRVIGIFNKLFLQKLQTAAGIERKE